MSIHRNELKTTNFKAVTTGRKLAPCTLARSCKPTSSTPWASRATAWPKPLACSNAALMKSAQVTAP